MDGVFSDRLTPILEPSCDGPGIPGEKRERGVSMEPTEPTKDETTPPVDDRRS